MVEQGKREWVEERREGEDFFEGERADRVTLSRRVDVTREEIRSRSLIDMP